MVARKICNIELCEMFCLCW